MTVELHHGDCVEVMKTWPEASIDALVTDPPAGVEFMGKAWDSFRDRATRRTQTEEWGASRGNQFARTPGGTPRFTGKGGPRDLQARQGFIGTLTPIFAECLRLLKPGAWGFVWALPRTSHWTATALEDAGFEIRDINHHLFGTGTPKTTDKATVPADWAGWNTAIKPAAEHWILVRKPAEGTLAQNLGKWGCGALNIGACKIPREGREPSWPANVTLSEDAAEELDAAVGTLRSGSFSGKRKADKFQNVYGAFRGQEEEEEIVGSEGGPSRFWFKASETLCHSCAYVKDAVESFKPRNESGGSAESHVREGTTGTSGSKHTGDQSDLPAPSTNATPSGSKRGSGSSTAMTPSSDAGFLPGSPHIRPSGMEEGETARSAENLGRRSTIQITDNPLLCDGCARRVISGSMSKSTEAGGPVGPKWWYIAKPSRPERELGCLHLPMKSAGEVTGGREESSVGLGNARAGAGRTSGRVLDLALNVKYPLGAWVNEVLSRALPADTAASVRKATVGCLIQCKDGSVWSMCWCGSLSTDPSRPDIKRIIGTKTSWITESRTWRSSQRLHTNGCMADAFGVMASGGNPVGLVGK